ncbi:MAG: hypothetical protein SOX56_05875 [[Pasteurella] mairii]|nr:hypothetical protein [[Pasteurella] mairii]
MNSRKHNGTYKKLCKKFKAFYHSQGAVYWHIVVILFLAWWLLETLTK